MEGMRGKGKGEREGMEWDLLLRRGEGKEGKKREEKRVNGRDRVKGDGRVSPQPKNQTSPIAVKRRSACTE